MNSLKNDWSKYLWDAELLENPRPVYYELTLSNTCNLDCSFCCSKDLRSNHEQTFMDEYTFRDILDEAFRNKVGIVITGGGESTLNPNFKNFVDIAEGYLHDGMIRSLNLVTNGTMVDNVRYFAEKTTEPKSWIRISINDRDLTKETELRKLIEEFPKRFGLSFIYDDLLSEVKCKTNAGILKPYAKFIRIRKAVTNKLENFTYKDCIGHNFVKVFEVDGSQAFCCWSRGLGGKPPKRCPDGCRWQCVNLDEAKALNPFS